MAVVVTNFSAGPLYGPSYVAADGFVGYPGSVVTNPSNPVLNPATFPGGMTIPNGSTYTTATGIVAHAGGGQAAATVLGAQTSQVTTVVTAADSVKAPVLATVGAWFEVVNNTANSMQLFGQGTDTINGAATAVGVAIASGKTANLICFVTGAWVGPVALS